MSDRVIKYDFQKRERIPQLRVPTEKMRMPWENIDLAAWVLARDVYLEKTDPSNPIRDIYPDLYRYYISQLDEDQQRLVQEDANMLIERDNHFLLQLEQAK